MPTAPPIAPPKPPPPKPTAKPAGNVVTAIPQASRDWKISHGTNTEIQKTVLYGPGGIGKSELCSLIEQCGIKPLFLDLDDGTRFLDVAKIQGIGTYNDLRAILHNESIWKDFGAVVIDTLTRVEELATAWVVANIPHEKGYPITGIESYGYGRGYTYVYEAMVRVLNDLDAHHRAGRHIICVAHDVPEMVKNPAGEDWLQYQPRLRAGKESNVRFRVREWADHLCYIEWDVAVTKEGKGIGAGTRTIYVTELPTHMAKSRSLSEPIAYEKGSAEFWKQLLKGRSNGSAN